MFFGYQKQQDFLWNAFKKERLAHAYLFSGEEEIGKKTLALNFIKSVFCGKKENRPCNRCLSCRMIDQLNHPDFVFLGGKEQEIKMGDIKNLCQRLILKASFSPFKAGLIDNAHLMNTSAENSLLKTLEEPKGPTVLFLISSRPNLLSETIRSRVQQIKFSLLSESEISDLVTEKITEEEKAREIIFLSRGRAGRAIRLIEDNDFFQKEKSAGAEFEMISKLDLAQKFDLAKSLSQQAFAEKLTCWLVYLRRDLFQKVKSGEETLNLIGKIRAIERAIYVSSKTNANKKVILENLMLKI